MPARKSPKKAAAKKAPAKRATKKAPVRKPKALPAQLTFKAYMLRTCAADMSSHSGFVWPESGRAVCRDWEPEARCGNGLHGLLWGAGDGSLLNWDESARWMVVGINEWVEIDGKVKAPEGHVVYTGDRDGAIQLLVTLGADPQKLTCGHVSIPGSKGVALVSGYRGTATAGESGTATAGNRGTATAGNWGTATAGESGTATAGNRGTATAGYRGTATAGLGGTATAGESGTATAGNRGTATAGLGGKSAANDLGVLLLKWWDRESNRPRYAIGYVGENGIEAKRFYTVDEKGGFVPTDEFIKEAPNAA